MDHILKQETVLTDPRPVFPTPFHQKAAYAVSDFFSSFSLTDTVLVVNSCARGQAVPESDLDFAILVKKNADPGDITHLTNEWLSFEATNFAIREYKKSGRYAHLHLDIVNGEYAVTPIEPSEPMSNFELEIGNQICYSRPIQDAGDNFQALKQKWLPYYSDTLQAKRLGCIKEACRYDLDRIPFLVKRELYFNAFDALYKAFQEYLQALFISNRTYPLAYNKWIKFQITEILRLPDIYPLLITLFKIGEFTGDEIDGKAKMLSGLLADVG